MSTPSQENPPPEQSQEYPGRTSEMDPQPRDEMRGYEGRGLMAGKRTLVTGGDSGIGRAVAVAFAKEGADVAIAYLSEQEDEDAQHTADLIKEAGHRCVTIRADLAEEANCQRAVDQAVHELGGLNILVNNVATQQPVQDFAELTTQQWDRTFKVNIYSYFWITKAAYPHLPDGGAVINTASINGLRGNKTLIDYSATKGAILALTYSLAQPFQERGIRVNSVAPGPVWTPLIPATFDENKVSALGGVAELDDGHDVQYPVDLPVPAPRQPVPDLVTGGGIDRRGAIPGGEVRLSREPGHLTDPGQQPGSAGGADPVQIGQGGAGGGEQHIEFLVRLLLALVDAFQVADQLGGDPAAGFARGIAGADPGEQRFGLGRGQVLLGPAGDELEQQLMQLGDHPGVVFTQRPAAVGQDPQHGQLLVTGHRAKTGHAGRGERDGVRIGGVGLAALPGGEHPGPGGQLGRDIDDVLAVGEQPVRQVPADALASLDRPGPFRPAPHGPAHRPVPRGAGVIPATSQHGLVRGHDLDRGRTLVRVHPDDHLAHLQPLLPGHAVPAEPGGHRYFELGKPLLSLSRSPRHPVRAGQMRATRPSADSRNESDEPGT
jgi:NAD(P)-dependent dehydrogenase (short-subunit alcohol dehydrogenase family)